MPVKQSSDSISPVIAGHRGFKGKYPENTFFGFEKCFEAGGTVIETDLWLSKDEELIISHDLSTKRVFVDARGQETDYKIPETSYQNVLKYLYTIEGREPLSTFKDVLRWFVRYIDEQDSDEHKLMLDIKRLNPPKVVKHIIKDLLEVHDDLSWWYHRIQFGIWDLNLIKYINQDEFFQKAYKAKPNTNKFGWKFFDIFHISVSWRDSVHYINYNFYLDSLDRADKDSGIIRFKITGISLLYLSSWSVGFLTKFVPLLRIQNLKFYSWTINTFEQYEYLCKVSRNANLPEYGVISDFPDLMFKHKQEQEQESNESASAEPDKSTELTRLTNSSQDFYDEDGNLAVKLTYGQYFSNLLYEGFQSLSGNKRVTDEERQFDLPVDENRVTKITVNAIFIYVFTFCQKIGIM
ncbi:Glycerophosphodiester phosphodiesterase [Scheffersomyces xylosifermentans]|uniref:Glycerophosphodiester phosphodiesterase n=1 Tax=Scheffersomyces xylosifermentans TaxID=1304137 RepID=UPI00315CD3E2